jgi:hypothetical protein
LAQAARHDRRIAAKREREREIWKQVTERFEEIRDQVPVVDPRQGQNVVARCAPSPQDKAAVIKHMSLPSSPEPMSGKVWLEGGFKRFPQQPNESIRAWSRRLSAEAREDLVQLGARTVETRIHEQRRGAKQ